MNIREKSFRKIWKLLQIISANYGTFLQNRLAVYLQAG